MSKGAFHRLAGILAVEYPQLRFHNVEPGYVVTERMEVNAKALGLDGVYPGAPPSVPASVIAWLATSPEAAELSGQTVAAQRFAKTHQPHPQRCAGEAKLVAGVPSAVVGEGVEVEELAEGDPEQRQNPGVHGVVNPTA